MQILIFCLSLFVLLAQFADFLLSEKGERRLRDLIAVLYVNLESDWISIFKGCARSVSDFLNSALGSTGPAFLIRVSTYSVVVSNVVGARYILSDPFFVSPGDLFWEFHQRNPILASWLEFQLLLALPNVLADLIGWWATRRLLGVVSRSEGVRLTLAIGAALLVVIACYWIATVASMVLQLLVVHEPIKKVAWMLVTGDPEVWDAPYYVMSTAVEGNYLGLTYAIVSFTPALPVCVFLCAFLVSVALVALQRPLRGPLALLLERLDGSPKHVLTMIAIAVSSLIAILRGWPTG